MSAKIVAVGLLTQREVEQLGDLFTRLWPVSETPCFGSLLAAIDDADRLLCHERDAMSAEASDVPLLVVERP